MNNSYSNKNSFKDAFNTFSNTPLGIMTNSSTSYNKPSYNKPSYNKPSYNQPSYNKPSYSEATYSDATNSEPKTNFVKSIFFWIFIIILLAFLGLNIFKYLAEGTDIVSGLLSPIAYIITMVSGDTAKTTLQHTSQGTQTIASETSNFLQILLKLITDMFNNSVNFIANSSTSGISYLQSTIKQDKITSTNSNGTNSNEEQEEEGVLKNERKIENRIQDVPNTIKNLINKKEDNIPEPSRSESQQHGYCYIGKENNSRYCAKVSSKSKCMSGDIFPTMDLCINPKLR
jgi:hypothetical protein